MKKIIKNALKRVLSNKIIDSGKTYDKNILIGLKQIQSKYGLYYKDGMIKFTAKCSICERENNYNIVGCNIPKSIEMIGEANMEPNFICGSHGSGSYTSINYVKHNILEYIENHELPYGYFAVKKTVKQIFPEKLYNLEDFLYKNGIEDSNSVLKVIYTNYGILAVITDEYIIDYPTFEYVTSTEVKEWETRSYTVNFNNFEPDKDIFDYEDKERFSNGDSEYEGDREYGDEEQTDFNIEWDLDLDNILDYVTTGLIAEIHVLGLNQLKINGENI